MTGHQWVGRLVEKSSDVIGQQSKLSHVSENYLKSIILIINNTPSFHEKNFTIFFRIFKISHIREKLVQLKHRKRCRELKANHIFFYRLKFFRFCQKWGASDRNFDFEILLSCCFKRKK